MVQMAIPVWEGFGGICNAVTVWKCWKSIASIGGGAGLPSTSEASEVYWDAFGERWEIDVCDMISKWHSISGFGNLLKHCPQTGRVSSHYFN